MHRILSSRAKLVLFIALVFFVSNVLFTGSVARKFRLTIEDAAGLASAEDLSSIRYIQLGGMSISLFLFGLVLNLVMTRERAHHIALNLTSELRKSESRLREVLENSLNASYKRNLRSNSYEYLSPVFYSLTGLTPDEMITMPLENVLQLMHPDDRAGVSCQFSEAMRGKAGNSFTIEYRFMHKEGRYVWLKDQFVVMHDPDGKPLACIGSISDITDLKDAAETLLLVTKRMESIIEGTNVGTWEWNIHTGALQIGDKWARFIGYSLEELGSIDIHTWERFVHPDDFEASNQALQRHFSGELPFYDIECRMKHRDGQWIWVHTRGSVQSRTEAGEPLMMYGTHADITKRKQTEAALEKIYQENRVLLAELQHRVKNSFSMISSMMHLAVASESSSEVTAKLTDLDARVRSVSDLYSLLYSSGSFTEASLDDYCRRITGSLVGLTENITLKLELEPVLASVKIAAPFGLIVSELLTNAIKYAFPGNRQGLITVRLRQENHAVLFEVQDDGVGIPAEKGLEGCTGMGFSLVHGLASQIKGQFRVESSTRGTTCIVEFSGIA